MSRIIWNSSRWGYQYDENLQLVLRICTHESWVVLFRSYGTLQREMPGRWISRAHLPYHCKLWNGVYVRSGGYK